MTFDFSSLQPVEEEVTNAQSASTASSEQRRKFFNMTGFYVSVDCGMFGLGGTDPAHL